MRAEPASGRRGHDRDRDHDRERDCDGDRQREVGEDLSFDVLQEQHRQEYGDRRRRRSEQRGHDLSRAFVRGLVDRHAAFFQSDDVAGDDDRAFDDHADGKREAGQRDHVDAATRELEHAERRQQADRNRACDQDRRAGIAHEPPHAREREQCADDEVLDQQVDRALDEQRCVERLLDAQAAFLERPVAQFRDDALHFFERAEHVRAGRAKDAQADRGIAVLIREELAIRRRHLDSRDIGKAHGLAVAPRQHELPKVLGVVATGVAQRVLPASDVELAGGHIRGARGLAGDVRDADAERGGACEVERDAHVVGRTALNLDLRDARDRFDARLDHVIDQAAMAFDRPLGAGQQLHEEERQLLVGVRRPRRRAARTVGRRRAAAAAGDSCGR